MSADSDARQFIDDMLAICQRHGHPAMPTADEYERAVRDAARPAARLARKKDPAHEGAG